MSESLVPVSQTEVVERFSAFSSPTSFENAQRMAKLLCASSIVPDSYKANVSDCVIALEMANRIGANPLAVMQNLYIVHGKPAWSSQFLISCVNTSGKFTPLRYRMTGEAGTDSYGCVAWAKDRSGETLESPEVSITMAKAEGWYTRNGSKWRTMPELMLRYRAATLFARLYAPELTMGMSTDDEIIDISPVVTEPAKTTFESLRREPVTVSETPLPNIPKTNSNAPVAEAKSPTAPKAGLTVLPSPEPVAEGRSIEAGEDTSAKAPAGEPPAAGKEEADSEIPLTKPAAVKPVRGAATLSHTACEEVVLRILGEVPGATFDDYRDWLSIRFNEIDFSDVGTVEDLTPYVCDQTCKQAAKLKAYLIKLVESRNKKG